MSKNIIKNIEELKELQAVLKKYNKQEAIKYIMDKTGVSENDSLEIYYFLTKNTSNSITHKQNKIFTSIIFYCLVSLTGIIILPTLGIVAPVFILCSFVCPIGGIIHLISGIFNLNLPIVSFQFGNITLSPFLGFILSVIIGIILYFIGKGCWKLLLLYINQVRKVKESLEI